MLVKSLKILALVAFAVFVLIDPAFAGGQLGYAESQSQSSLFTQAEKKAAATFINVRTIIFIVGGFGLVGLAFGAIFGRVNWKWFAALATGLLILAAAGAIVDYSTESSVGGYHEDTFTGS